MGIMAFQAVCRSEWLVLVSLLKVCILRIMAIKAECRRGLGEMETVFGCGFGSGLVRYMTGITAHVQGSMTASAFWHVQAGLMATEAEVLFLSA